MPLYQRFKNHAEHVERGADPGQNQHDREDLSRRAQRVDLAESHRGDRGDRLVHRVEQAESEQQVANRAGDHDADYGKQRQLNAPDMAHGAIVSPAPGRGRLTRRLFGCWGLWVTQCHRHGVWGLAAAEAPGAGASNARPTSRSPERR